MVGVDDDCGDEVSVGEGAEVGPLNVDEVGGLCEFEALVVEAEDVGVGVGVAFLAAVGVGDGVPDTTAGADVVFGRGGTGFTAAVGVAVGVFFVAVATSCDTAGLVWNPSITAAAAAGASKMKFTPDPAELANAKHPAAPMTSATPAPTTPPSNAGRRERVTSPAGV